jgi:hypothetical protein
VDVLHRPWRQARAAAAPGCQEIAVELCYLRGADSLQAERADVRFNVPVDQVTVVLEGLGLDLDSVGFDPLIQVAADGHRAPVYVLARAGSDPRLITCGFGILLGREAADPPGPALASSGIFDPDNVRPGFAAFHDPVADLRCSCHPTARLLALAGRDLRHQAAASAFSAFWRSAM